MQFSFCISFHKYMCTFIFTLLYRALGQSYIFMIKLIILLLMAFLAVLAAFALRYQTRNDSVEGFANKIDSSLLATMYQGAGIERCEALYADPATKPEIRSGMSTKSIEAMDAYTTGFRVREWLPTDVAVASRQNRTMKYCYMLFDSNNGAIDPLLKGQSCDMRNPVFQASGLIKNVFADSNLDITHSLPYTKCVLEVDPKALATETLDNFWSRMGDQQCNNYKEATQFQMSNLSDTLTSLSNEYSSFLDSDKKYTTCMSAQRNKQQANDAIYNMFMQSNCAFYGNCSNIPGEGSLQKYKQTYEDLTASVTSTEQEVRTINSNLAVLDGVYGRDKRRFAEQEMYLKSLTDALAKCSNVDVPAKREALKTLSEDYVRLINTSNMIYEQLNACIPEREKKEAQRDELVGSIKDTEMRWQSSNDALFLCLRTNEYLQQTIATLKDQTQKVQTQNDECSAALISGKAELATLEKEVEALEKERDYWIKKCTYEQKQMISNSVKTVNELRRNTAAYTKKNCGNDMKEAEDVNDLIQKKFEALAMLNTPPPCDETKRAECCKAIGKE